MALTTRQDLTLGNQDWQKVYESFRNADFQSYDYQTLRKSMIDYLKIYYPEDFNDFVESSEYIALIDLIAFLGQSLAYRIDLNARENFIDTAERRDSVLKLAKLISYIPKRNQAARGLLKFDSVQTTQQLIDSNGENLTGSVVNWNDSTNSNWYEQFITILNAAFVDGKFGNPYNSKSINNILTNEYKINTPSNIIPVFTFSSLVDSQTLDFEIVSATTSGKSVIYEELPSSTNGFNILYRNDNRGNASNNTGFFLYFKQGTLRTETFNVNESIPNNVIPVSYNNINNDDVWLVKLGDSALTDEQWAQTEVVAGQNAIYNNSTSKNIYQITTRNNDQIDLVFGDGTFGAIPEGRFRIYFRTSAGVTYTISPDEMQGVTITIPYYSEAGRLEQLTVTASLQYTIGNALARESINDIKTRAPQQYYTQNRMVTGEDYNIFPYTRYSTISKVKAVNRTSTGVSRYLSSDTTGKYSSTNIFADDGVLWQEESIKTKFKFGWNTDSDINSIIANKITPLLQEKSLLHFYYKNFARQSISNFYWTRVTSDSGSSTGYFTNSPTSTTPLQVGVNVSGAENFIRKNAILVFDVTNYPNTVDIQTDIASDQDGNSYIYATVISVQGNGTQTQLSNGKGSILLNKDLPDNIELVSIIPAYANSFSQELIREILNNITDYKEFGLRYSQRRNSWAIINFENLDTTSNFSQEFQGDTINSNKDSSWLIRFSVTGSIFTVFMRSHEYKFSSSRTVKFYFNENSKIFNYENSQSIVDSIKVLRVNSNIAGGDINWNIYDQEIESDGYKDQSRVLVTFSDTDNDGIPDNPDIFSSIVSGSPVFFRIVNDNTSSDRYERISGLSFIRGIDSTNEIRARINNYSVGQLFYVSSENKSYQIESTNGNKILVERTDIIKYNGRPALYFQYKHNADIDRTLNPNSNNLIDLYVLTNEYETSFRTWLFTNRNLQDIPRPPSAEDLRLQYNDLENYKAVSDQIIFNSASYKLLFGNLAPEELQATFKIIKNPNGTVSDNEIKNRVLNLINLYFSSEYWDFGETFYFTEMATYIQKSLPSLISSIIIVPNSSSQTFGSLQQISSSSNEILISCATVDDIEVISSITDSQLRN
jgi:hypothetical protein